MRRVLNIDAINGGVRAPYSQSRHYIAMGPHDLFILHYFVIHIYIYIKIS
jgi:hypothetical protein